MSLNNNDNSTIQSRDSESVEIRAVRSMTCYICLENILTTQRQFGLQNNCDHVFCFDCLATWRRTGNMIDKNTGGRCPLCRVRSTFIAPSWRCFNNTDEKRSLIDAHKLRLKRIPCRTLLRYGYCRFDHRCYYNHNIASSRWSSSSIVLQENPRQSTNENDFDVQQQPPRRITYNSHRYRPY